MDFKCAIFDLDGTLVDSMNLWEQIDIDCLAKRGIKVPDDYIENVTVMGLKLASEYTIDRFGLNETPESLVKEWLDKANLYYSDRVKLKPYAKEYLNCLKERGIKLGIATGNSHRLLEATLKNNGVYHMFDSLTTADEVCVTKEQPDIYLLAADKMKTHPRDCVVFEDIAVGIKSAKGIGMKTVGVYDRSAASDRKLIKSMADKYIESFAEMMQ